jgi:hypothetical protein
MSGNLLPSQDSDFGEALQIVSIENEKFLLNEDNLKRIFLDPKVKDNKVNLSLVEHFLALKAY